MNDTNSSPVVPNTFRTPRPLVLINGDPVDGGTTPTQTSAVPMDGVVSVEIDANNQYEASTWKIEANLDPLYKLNANWWSNQSKVIVTIQVGFEDQTGQFSGVWTPLIGIVDDYEINLDESSITLTGRDLSALLIDTKTAETYSNNTASEIVTTIAQQQGLTPVVTSTTAIAGSYYQIDTTTTGLGAFSHEMTQWDLLIYLAQQAGFDMFVDGWNLVFQPKASTNDNPYVVEWWMGDDGIPQSNVIGLKLQHSLTLAKGVSVTIKSHSTVTGKTVTARAQDPDYKSSYGDGTQDYVFYVPNLSSQAAQDLANQRYADITRHLRTICFDMPADSALSPRGVILLSGTQTAFDGCYYPDRINMTLSVSDGFMASVEAKNIPPTPSAAISTLTNGDGAGGGSGNGDGDGNGDGSADTSSTSTSSTDPNATNSAGVANRDDGLQGSPGW